MEGKDHPSFPKQFGNVSFSGEEERSISSCLTKKLGKDDTTSRTGAGNAKYTYIESWRSISLANSIFGFNGWSCAIVDLSPDFIEEDHGRFSVGITAVVRITLKDGTSHEDVGYGTGEHTKRGLAIEKAKKEAVSDARKRALRIFGDAMGNCLYDKQHLKRIKSGKGGDDLLCSSDLPFGVDGFGSLRESPLLNVKKEKQETVNIHSETTRDIHGYIPQVSPHSQIKREVSVPQLSVQVKSEPNSSPVASISPSPPEASPPNGGLKLSPRSIHTLKTPQKIAPTNGNHNQSNYRYQPYSTTQAPNLTENQNQARVTFPRQLSQAKGHPAPFRIADNIK